MAKTIEELRKEKGMTRTFLAKQLGMHYNTLYRKERGITNFTISEFRKCAEILNVDMLKIKV